MRVQTINLDFAHSPGNPLDSSHVPNMFPFSGTFGLLYLNGLRNSSDGVTVQALAQVIR
jgi:hypothetical protein